MYLIRSFGDPRTITLECSGELESVEATRAISQVAALAEVDLPRAVICDVRAVERGPEDTLAVVAALSASASAAYRLAIVAHPGQQRFVRRLLRVARLPHGAVVAESPEEASARIERLQRGVAASSTARRHAREFAASDRGLGREPAVKDRTSVA